MLQPLVSIALASFNGAKYIEEQIYSILNQTINDIEIVVSDDLSTDSTPELLERLANDSKIKWIRNQSRLGVIKNFENALRHCTGKYIAFSDQDDIWLPFKIEKSLKKITELESEYGSHTPCLIYTDAKVVDDNLTVLYHSYLKVKQLNPTHVKLKHLIVENVPTGCTMLMNRSLTRLVSLIPAKVTMHDVFIAMTASCFGKMSYLDEQTLLYRQHANNIYGAALKTKFSSFKSTIDVIFNKNSKSLFLKKEIEQAKAFYNLFDQTLNKQDKILLEDFIGLEKQNKVLKVCFLLKHGIVKGSLMKTLNFFLKI